MTLSVVIITKNEQANLPRALASVMPLVADGAGEIVVVDCGSTDRTVEIARAHGARVFVEPWKGFSRQKNSALDKASGDWILSLDADEELAPRLVAEIGAVLRDADAADGYWMPRANIFMGRVMRHGVWSGDWQLRLIRRGAGRFSDRVVHEFIQVAGPTARLQGTLVHWTSPDLATLIDKLNRYSTLAAEAAVARKPRGFNFVLIAIVPPLQFFKFYILWLGFLDGREGLLLNACYAMHLSWKYIKAWEISRRLAAAPAKLAEGAPHPRETP